MTNRASIELLVQVVTSLAVIGGLALVVWELKQNREAASSQLTSEAFTYVSALSQAVMGEQTAEVLARACDNPKELSRADYYVLENYYSEILNRYRRIARLQERGSLYDDASLDVPMGLGNLFDSAPGRAYLKREAETDSSVVGEALRRRLASWDGMTCAEYFGEWQELVESELGEHVKRHSEPN